MSFLNHKPTTLESTFSPHSGEPVVIHVHAKKTSEWGDGVRPGSVTEDKVETYVFLGAYIDEKGETRLVFGKVENGEAPEAAYGRHLKSGVPQLSGRSDADQAVFAANPANLTNGKALATSAHYRAPSTVGGVPFGSSYTTTHRTLITSDTPADLPNNTGTPVADLAKDNETAVKKIEALLQEGPVQPKSEAQINAQVKTPVTTPGVH